MTEISRDAFSMQAETEEELTNNLLTVVGYTHDTYMAQINITADILASNHTWVQNHLADLINANLTHLGYVMKDTKTQGMMGEYNDAMAKVEQKAMESESLTPAITITDEIIAEDGTINISYLSNATNLLKLQLVS